MGISGDRTEVDRLIVAYATRTGNVQSFVKRTRRPYVKITEDLRLAEPFILVTYTDKFGEAPELVRRFLARNNAYLRGVAASGNRNFGPYFGGAADEVVATYGAPVICRFELAGTPSDIRKFNEGIDALE